MDRNRTTEWTFITVLCILRPRDIRHSSRQVLLLVVNIPFSICRTNGHGGLATSSCKWHPDTVNSHETERTKTGIWSVEGSCQFKDSEEFNIKEIWVFFFSLEKNKIKSEKQFYVRFRFWWWEPIKLLYGLMKIKKSTFRKIYEVGNDYSKIYIRGKWNIKQMYGR